MRNGQLQPKHMSFSASMFEMPNSCPATDMMAKHSTHENWQQRNFCHRSCCVCVERHISSQMQTEAEGGQCRQ